MNAWRVGYGVGLLAFVAVPLLLPFAGLLEPATWRWNADDAERIAQCSLSTFALAVGTLVLALPLGIALAVLLFRTSFLLRRCLLFLLLIALFVPLPILASSWQALLGTGSRPWATGMAAAIWIHTLTAIPWVAFIVGLGLTWAEPEWEEEAGQSVGPWRVLALVTLPRARASVLAAALFIVLQTAAETAITDIMLVRTLADELRTQFALPNDLPLARTLLLALPGLLLAWGLAMGALSYLEKQLPPPAPSFRAQRTLGLGSRWLHFVVAFLLLGLLLVPQLSLIWKLGLTGHPPHWSAEVAWHFLWAESRILGMDLVSTIAMSFATGLGVAVLALVGCWLARESWRLRWLLFSVLMWAWVLPGPAVGIGLHSLIMYLPGEPWDSLLYRGPSPLPLMWVQTIRALPIAVAFLWPVVRMIPREWFEEARLGGAGVINEFLHVVLPLTWRAALVTAVASAALCLGEVGASIRVDTPGWKSFTNTLLDRMHYGVDNTLSALSLLLLASIVLLAGIGWMSWQFIGVNRAPSER